MLEQLLIKGMSIGAIYAMLGIGFCLLWQTSRLVNFAQGEFVTVSAFLILLFYSVLKLPLFLATFMGIVAAAFVLGFVVKKTLAEPLMPRGNIAFVVGTIGLGFLVKDSLTVFVSAEALPFPAMIPQKPLHYAGAMFSSLDIWNICVAAVMIVSLHLFIRKTKPGKALQAVAQNRQAADIMGIDAQKMILLAFVINAVLAAFSATLVAPITWSNTTWETNWV
jgi:branched-chain amino acid transport system permease protein